MFKVKTWGLIIGIALLLALLSKVSGLNSFLLYPRHDDITSELKRQLDNSGLSVVKQEVSTYEGLATIELLLSNGQSFEVSSYDVFAPKQDVLRLSKLGPLAAKCVHRIDGREHLVVNGAPVSDGSLFQHLSIDSIWDLSRNYEQVLRVLMIASEDDELVDMGSDIYCRFSNSSR